MIEKETDVYSRCTQVHIIIYEESNDLICWGIIFFRHYNIMLIINIPTKLFVIFFFNKTFHVRNTPFLQGGKFKKNVQM